MKPVTLSPHAASKLVRRGTSTAEIETALREAEWQPARHGRLECRKDFEFDSEWNGRHYTTKQVHPVFVDEPDEIVVVTVYVYYF